MKEWGTKFFLLVSILYYFLHFLFLGVLETTDSYFYWAFASFLRTGEYIVPHPYHYIIPSTIEPPLYSLLLYLGNFFPRADIFIHLFQIIFLLVSGFLLYKIISHYISVYWARIIGGIFFLIPAHTVEISAIMSETTAIFFFSLYLYIAFLIISKKRVGLIGMLLVLTSIMPLLRYNFIVFFGITLVWMFLWKGKIKLLWYYLSISIVIILSWVSINYFLNGSWGLSNVQGKHLYDRIVAGDQLLPPEDDPSLVKLRALVNKDINLKVPFWDIEPHIIHKLKYKDTEVSKILGQVALSALIHHPLEYGLNTIKNIFIIHGNGLIFPHNSSVDGRWMGKCTTMGNIHYCAPIIKSTLVNSIIRKIIEISEWYYNTMPIWMNLVFLLPAFIYALLQKERFVFFCAILYFFGVLISVMFEVPVFRYLYPFYPLKIILVVYMINSLIIPSLKRRYIST